MAFGVVMLLGHVADACLVRIEAGKKGCARGTTTGGIVKLCETHAAPGEFVEIGCMDFAAVTTEIRIPHIIHKDDDDVRASGRRAYNRKVRRDRHSKCD